MFFFFKQKTAYGLRISDWSSDVCSSDLSRRGVAWLRESDRPSLIAALAMRLDSTAPQGSMIGCDSVMGVWELGMELSGKDIWEGNLHTTAIAVAFTTVGDVV